MFKASIYRDYFYRGSAPPGPPLVRKFLANSFAKRGYKIFKVMPFDPKARELGTDCPSIAYSMVGCKRLDPTNELWMSFVIASASVIPSKRLMVVWCFGRNHPEHLPFPDLRWSLMAARHRKWRPSELRGTDSALISALENSSRDLAKRNCSSHWIKTVAVKPCPSCQRCFSTVAAVSVPLNGPPRPAIVSHVQGFESFRTQFTWCCPMRRLSSWKLPGSLPTSKSGRNKPSRAVL